VHIRRRRRGTRIRLSAKARPARAAGRPGDLYIFVHLARHSVFQRDGTTCSRAARSASRRRRWAATIEVPGLDRRAHEIKIPAGIQSGKQLRVRGAGMTVLNGRGNGDMVIQVEVETPTRLSSRQKEILEEFRKTETARNVRRPRAFSRS
jgi:molecular chaperone DnaJ